MKSLGKLVLCIHTCSLMVFMHSLFYTHITHTCKHQGVCGPRGYAGISIHIYCIHTPTSVFFVKNLQCKCQGILGKKPKSLETVFFFFFSTVQSML